MMFPVIRTNGRSLFGELSRDMDRLFGEGLCPVTRSMAVDIHEEGDVLVLEAEVPGVSQEELDITVENGTLSIAVTQKTESERKEEAYFVRERRVGNVRRMFRLPETADADRVEAHLAHGVLTLRLPKKEEAKPRQIQVK